MNSQEIVALVTERAKRFGDRDSQQFGQLVSRLRKLEEGATAEGGLLAFTEGSPALEGSSAQELAGALQATIKQRGLRDLEPLLRAVLPRYELSVEQLPRYMAETFGACQVEAALRVLEEEPFGGQYRRAIETFRFWLDGFRREGGAT